MFKVNDTVQIIAGAVYLNNDKEVPNSLLNTKLYVREAKNGSYVIARAKTGPILGEISADYLKATEGNIVVIEPYYVNINEPNFPLYHSSNKNSGIIKRLDNLPLLTIIDEKNGFGKVKVGPGWVDLSKVEKI
jgi:hypothetical protein